MTIFIGCKRAYIITVLYPLPVAKKRCLNIKRQLKCRVDVGCDWVLLHMDISAVLAQFSLKTKQVPQRVAQVASEKHGPQHILQCNM